VNSQTGLAIAIGLVAVGLIVGGWLLLSGPAPVELAKEAADAKANAKEQALRDLKSKIDVEEQRHLALDPGIRKHSKEICDSHPDWGVRACDAIAQGQIYVGMTAEQVRSAWGKPRAVNPMSIRREQWIYVTGSVDLENDVVASFQK